MFACAALGFISLGQTFALLLGGIDLSVGPLAGFLVVVGSFFILDGKSPAIWVLGFGLMLACAVRHRPAQRRTHPLREVHAVAATLVTYIGLGGLSFTLRSAPDGYIAASVTSAIATKVGPVPVAFIVFVACALGLELALRKSRLGLRMRAVGSDEESARRVGVPVNRTALLGYLGASLLTLLGAVVLLAQLGVGDPGQGTGYTLTSITAVVLGGTSLLGGRGTFIGTLDGSGAERPGAERHGLPEPRSEVAVHLPGPPDRRRGDHLQPGATRPGRAPGRLPDGRRALLRHRCKVKPHSGRTVADASVDARTAAARDPARPRYRPPRARAPARALAELDLADRDGQDAALRAHALRARLGVRRDRRRGALRPGLRRPARSPWRSSESSPAAAGPGLAVQRAEGRPAISLNSGVTWERLMFWADEDVEFIEATYEPGGASSPDDALVRHSGHEFGHVLTGTLRVVVGFDEFVLEPGDSITFPSSTPHRLSNDGQRDGARDLGRARPPRRAAGHERPTEAACGSRIDNGRRCAASLNGAPTRGIRSSTRRVRSDAQ